jgi:O-glycosyl hydrolase
MSSIEQRAIHASAKSTISANINTPICLGFLVNLGTISLLAFGGSASHLVITVLVISINVLAIIGIMGGIDDYSAWVKDQDAEQAQTNVGQQNAKTPFGFYRIVIVAIFGSLAISQLYMMHLG